MKKDSVQIRVVTEADAPKLLEIYAPYVQKTIVTYEYEVPTEEEFRGRIRNTLKRYPYFAAEKDGEILGYAYASAMNTRAAADWSAEATVYLREDAKGKGIGRMLYTALEDALKEQHVIRLYAKIADPNPDSVAFHEAVGYQFAGKFTDCGYKLGQWIGLILMEKQIGVYTNPPQGFIPYMQKEKG